MKHIQSPENQGYRELLRLARSARALREGGLALLEGAHLVEAYCARHGAPRRLLLDARAQATPEAKSLAAKCGGADVWALGGALFEKLAQTVTPSGVLALVEIPGDPGPLAAGQSCILLEDIQDPGNLGVLLRVAAAAGLARAYLSRQCAYAWSAKTLRAAQGAHFCIEVAEAHDLPAIARSFAGRRVATVVRGGTPWCAADLRGPTAFMFGNEGAGLSEPLIQAADLRLSIPMPGGMESLNVASAAAVVVFEKLRQDSNPR